MEYVAFHFVVDPPEPGSEILMAMIADQGFDTFEQTASGFTAWLPASKVHEVMLDDLTFAGFTYSYSTEHVATRNWNEEWEKKFEPVIIDKLLCIRAPFHKNTAHGCPHEIVIMPKMSFGTGHHQTTRLMCRQISLIDLKGKKVLDMGCGTGVLAIFARQRGAADVWAVDNDHWSIENARENCESNGFGDIKVVEAAHPVNEGLPFDLILANINRNVLRAQLSAYAKVSHTGSVLVISGFFVTDREELLEAAATAGFRPLFSESEDSWCVIRFEKI